MAIYRNVSMTFWTDSKVSDNFLPEEKYMFLYLFTNPHTNLCGCYEVSRKQIAYEMGYSVQKVNSLLNSLAEKHDVIRYSDQTNEVLLLNWHKYNWTKSEKFRVPLRKEIQKIKCVDFKEYLTEIYNGNDTVSIGYQYRMDTTVSVSVTDTVPVTDNKKSKNDIFKDVPEAIKDAFMAWVQMRKDKKKPIKTEIAVKRALNKLNALTKNTEKQKELIEYAVYRNWESFYPIPDGDKIPKPKVEAEQKGKTIDAVPMPEETKDALSKLGYGNIIGEKGAT